MRIWVSRLHNGVLSSCGEGPEKGLTSAQWCTTLILSLCVRIRLLPFPRVVGDGAGRNHRGRCRHPGVRGVGSVGFSKEGGMLLKIRVVAGLESSGSRWETKTAHRFSGQRSTPHSKPSRGTAGGLGTGRGLNKAGMCPEFNNLASSPLYRGFGPYSGASAPPCRRLQLEWLKCGDSRRG